MTSLSLTVLTVPERESQGRALARRLKAKVVVDEKREPTRAHAEAWYRAVEAADDGDSWVGVIEDDAVPAEGLTRPGLEAMLNVAPADVVSGYLGTGRPWDAQSWIKAAVERDPHFVVSFQVLHHVALFMRARLAADAADYLFGSRFPCDEGLTVWAQRKGVPVAYCYPSVFDHADEDSMIDRGPDRVGEVRKAWASGVRDGWDASSLVLLDRPTVIRYGRRYEQVQGAFR